MLFWKAIRFLWPFLREMFLGDKSLKEAVRTHFGRVLLVGVIMLSIALNFFTIPRMFKISYDYVELKRRHDALIKQRYPHADVEVQPPPKGEEAAGAPPPDVAHAPLAHSVEEYRRTKEFFDRMREQERRHR